MRVNMEDEELSSSNLRTMEFLIRNNHELINHRKLAIGYLIELWHQSINKSTENVVESDIIKYLDIHDDEAGRKMITILVKSGYLSKNEDGTYTILGKDKDFSFRKSCAEKGRKGGLTKAENREKSIKTENVAKLEKTLVNPSPARKNVAPANFSLPIALHSNADHSITLQYNTEKIRSENTTVEPITVIPQIISAPAPGIVAVAPIKKKKHTRTEAEQQRAMKFKEAFFEGYSGAMRGNKPAWGPKEYTNVYEIISTYSLEDLFEMINVYFVTRPFNSLRDGYPLVGYGSSFKSLAAQLYADVKNPGRRVLAKNNEKSFDEHMKIQEKLNLINNRKLV
jgi:hypothetical protein